MAKFTKYQGLLIRIILSIMFSIGIGLLLRVDESDISYSNSIISVLVCFSYLILLKYWCERHVLIQKLRISNILLLLAFWMCMFAGRQIDYIGKVDFLRIDYWIAIIVLTISSEPVLRTVFELLKNSNIVFAEGEDTPRFYSFVSYWLFLIGCYFPVLLAVYPGFFSYDAETECYMVFTEKYSEHHPLVHELLLGETVRLGNRLFGSYYAGIFLYILIQMLVISAAFAYVIYSLRVIGVKKIFRIISVLYFGLFPTVSMFVLCSTKDVYFSLGVTLMILLLLLWSSGEKIWSVRSIIIFIVSSCLILLFRKNGIYIYPFFIIGMILVYKAEWKKTLGFGAAILCLCIGINSILSFSLNAKKDEMAEMLSVPIQQLARTHSENRDTFSDEDLELLYTLIPESILEKYNPKLADPVKINFLEDNFNSDKSKYINLWVKYFKKNPSIYINSVLVNTYGYWYPDTLIGGYEGVTLKDGYFYGESSYFEFITENPGTRESKIPWLEKFYEKISLEVFQQKIPVISQLFSMGFWLWVVAAEAVFLAQKKKKEKLLVLLLPLLLFLTNLLGPIALIRYMLFLFFSLPLLLLLPFSAQESD